MAPVPLDPFGNYFDTVFHIGGNVHALIAMSSSWRKFSNAADQGADDLRNLNLSSFKGSEGDLYREVVTLEYSKYLRNASSAHEQAALKVEEYAGQLLTKKREMEQLIAVARGTHSGVNTAVVEWEAAATASLSPDPATKLAAQAAMAAAEVKYNKLMATWQSHLTTAESLKEDLRNSARGATAWIDRLKREKHFPKVSWLGKTWRKIDNQIDRGEELLQVGSALLSLLPWTQGLATAGHTLLAVSGNLEESFFGAVLKGPLRGLNILNNLAVRLQLRERLGLQAASQSPDATVGDRATAAGEPINMATGALIDRELDINIPGRLPLRLTRTLNTRFLLDNEESFAFGAGWFSELDVRLEIHDDAIYMLTADSAILTFEVPPSDGSEVSANGRAMRLSYGDGVYRVRDLENAQTWSFNASGKRDCVSGGLSDSEPSIGRSSVGAGIRPGSVASVFEQKLTYKVTSLVDRFGMAIDVDYDRVTGRARQVRRSDGTILHLEWDDVVSHISRVSVSNRMTHPGDDPMVLMTYEYNPDGQLIRVINTHDDRLDYRYDSTGRLDGWTDRNGIHYCHIYDDEGRVVAQAGSGGAMTNALVWLPDEETGGHVCVLIETAGEFSPEKAEAETFVDVLQRAQAVRELSLIAALDTGAVSPDDLQEAGSLLLDDVHGDLRPTVYRSTQEGDVWQIVTPMGAAREYIYNDWHQRTGEISESGEITRFDYGEYGHVVRTKYSDGTEDVIEEGPWGSPVRKIDRSGRVTTFEVDEFGVTTAVTHPDGSRDEYDYEVRPTGIFATSETDADGVTKFYELNDAGLTIAESDAQGNRSTLVRNVLGQVTEVINPGGDTTSLRYTAEGWPIEVIHQDGTTQRAEFDGEGNRVTRTNELGNTATTKYTALDKPYSLTDESGAVTRIDYNTQLEPVLFTNADGRTWEFRYDLDGRCVGQTDFNGVTTNVVASGKGSEISVSPVGEKHSYFDAGGKLLREIEAGQTTSYEYDFLGRTSAIVTDLTRLEYEYDDAFDRVTTETMRLISGDETRVHYEYSPAGRLLSCEVTLPDGQIIRSDNTFDMRGEIALVAVDPLGQFTFETDAIGRRCGIEVGAVIDRSTYDVRNRLVSRSLTSHDGERILHRQFGWRADDVLTSVTSEDSSKSFDVDPLGRLTASRTTEGDHEQFSYSSAGVLRSATDTTRSDFDADYGFVGTVPVRVGRTTYEYDEVGRVIRTITKRVSKRPLVKEFYYTAGTQPIGFSSSDEPDVGWRYIYDGAGRRVAKEKVDRVSASVIDRVVFVHSGDRLVAQQSQGGSSSSVVWVRDPVEGGVVAQAESAGGSWQLNFVVTGLSGAPEALVGVGSGEVVGQTVSGTFGRSEWSGADCPLLFEGQYLDRESGWAYNRFRFFDPESGFYNTSDPLGVAPEWGSGRGYVIHPWFMVDLLGLKSCQRLGYLAEELVSDMIATQDVEHWEQVPVNVSVVKTDGSGNKTVKRQYTRIDNVIRDQDGNWHFIEVKTGNATLTPPQNALRDEVNAARIDETRKVKDVKLEEPTWRKHSKKNYAMAVVPDHPVLDPEDSDKVTFHTVRIDADNGELVVDSVESVKASTEYDRAVGKDAYEKRGPGERNYLDHGEAMRLFEEFGK
ncbi:DUF6531 domain-containing protein [Corynebacterium cystitidis]|uniref:DUF6531 domain-containing protein n=1 Tax=Corynebacterium cystitidis TaxID=35757 RepID=UPI00211DBD8D|nr:DUF6531 domain-containing protein [Corynebacterium cystitidis]